MKKLVLLAVLAVLLIGLGASGYSQVAGEKAELDLTIVNETGFAINEFYLKPSNETRWGFSLLQNGATIPTSARYRISWPFDEKADVMDIRVRWTDNDRQVWSKVNLEKAVELVIKYDGTKCWYEIKE